MKSLKLLKKIDIFATSIKTYLTSRDKKLDKKSFSDVHGSIIGGIISLSFFLVSILFFLSFYKNMMNRSHDIISHTDGIFDLNGPEGVYHIVNSSYLPYIELRNMHT